VRLKYSLIISFILFVLLAFFSSGGKRVINYNPSYSSGHKIPYGCYVLRQSLPDLFPYAEITDSEETLYTGLNWDFSGQAIIIIDMEADIDELSAEYLAEWVAMGNTAFISSQEYPKYFEDSLGIDTEWYTLYLDTLYQGKLFTNPVYDSLQFSLSSGGAKFSRQFVIPDSIDYTVLGKYEKGRPNFIKMDYGKGEFYFNTLPQAFTNINVLDSVNGAYAPAALSYIRENEYIIWDNRYVTARKYSKTPVRYLLEQEPVRYAYFTALFTLLIFMIFSLKRRQKPIPVYSPPVNSTMEFVKTLGNLFKKSGDYKDIALKRYAYFGDFVRNRLHINLNSEDDKLPEQLAAKSRIDIYHVNKLLRMAGEIKSVYSIDSRMLTDFNTLLDYFYSRIRNATGIRPENRTRNN
jgi:hypothetical protein